MTAPLDLTDPAFMTDPYPAFAQWRERSPVTWHESSGQWLVFTYAECNAVLRDRRLGRSWRDKEPAAEFEPFNLLHRHQMMENEPPDHTRLRSLVSKAFARGHIERLRPLVQGLADELLDTVAGQDEIDLLADYAEPLPVAVIAELLGVPAADRDLLRPWSAAIVAMYELRRGPGAEQAATAASAEFADYVRDLVRARRARPRDDLISHLAAAEDAGQRLTDDEVVASAILLLNAGHEASVNAFGNGIVALLARPDELDRVRADPGLVASAVEEMVRFDSPLQLFQRTALADVSIAGVQVREGEQVAVLLGAANRDPAQFAEPDRFDAGRRGNHHLGFGAGLHHCLGAPLARMELAIALPTLLRRYPTMVLAQAPPRRPTFVLRGHDQVLVSVGAAEACSTGPARAAR